MDVLVSLFLRARRGARGSLPLVGPLLLAALVALHAAFPLDGSIFAGVILLVLAFLAVRAWQRTTVTQPRPMQDLELALLLAVAAYAAAIHVDGGLDGRFYPLVFVAVGVMSAFAKPFVTIGVIGLMVAFEAGVRWLTQGQVDPQLLLPHLGFAMVFGMLNTLSLRFEVARLRRASRSELQAERDRIRDEARSYRLLRAPIQLAEEAPPSSRALDEERLFRSGVEEIELSVLFALRLVRECLGVHTAMLLWLDDDRTQLRISELSSEETNILEGPFSARDGILGMVLTQHAPVSVAPIKPAFLLPYYEDEAPVGAACAVPVFEHGLLQGVLVVDRVEARRFSDEETVLLERAAHFCSRAIENERVFVQLERTKSEQGRLYRAAERLGAAISEQDVVEAGVRSASEIAAVDFAAFTAFDRDTLTHQIRAVVGDGESALLDATFESNRGLVTMALENRHPLPYRGEYDPSHHVVFDRELVPPPLPSLLVLPLVVHDNPLGSLVLGSREVAAFSGSERNLLEVLASHLAVSLANARMVKKLEEQATTDPMTGLLNKRAMLDTANEKLRAAKRFGRRLSVLVADIDHFKKVNDTYGHDVGDVVIKGLGALHKRAKRNTDAVARFGGEEFVTICEETDAEGAILLAERIRREFEKTTFHAHGQTLECTCSIGIATFPAAGETWDELFKSADEALYVSKRGGRNRVTVWDPRKVSAA